MNIKFIKEIYFKLKAYLILMLGLLLQSLFGLLTKTILTTNIHPFTILSYRGIAFCLYSIIFIFYENKQNNLKFNLKHLNSLIVRGFVNGIGMTGIIFCVPYVRLSTLELILRTGNMTSPFLSYLFIGEVVTMFDIYALSATFIGVVFILRPSIIFGKNSFIDGDTELGIVIALCVAMIIAVGMVLSKKLLNHFNEVFLLFFMGLFSILFGIIGCSLINQNIKLNVSLYIIVQIFLVCSLEFWGAWLVFKAISLETITKLSPFYNSKIIYAVYFTYYTTGNITFLDLLGAGIIISCYGYISYLKMSKN